VKGTLDMQSFRCLLARHDYSLCGKDLAFFDLAHPTVVLHTYRIYGAGH
jgi:hypothetical protein